MDRMIATVWMAGLVAVAACGGAEESSESEAADSGDETDSASPSFTMRLDRATTEENVLPQIVAAARGSLSPCARSILAPRCAS